jgi:hypothetical protein
VASGLAARAVSLAVFGKLSAETPAERLGISVAILPKEGGSEDERGA